MVVTVVVVVVLVMMDVVLVLVVVVVVVVCVKPILHLGLCWTVHFAHFQELAVRLVSASLAIVQQSRRLQPRPQRLWPKLAY